MRPTVASGLPQGSPAQFVGEVQRESTDALSGQMGAGRLGKIVQRKQKEMAL